MTTYQQPIESSGTVEIQVENKSGFVTTFTLSGKTYTVTAGCECPTDDITLYDAPQRFDASSEHGVILVCANHGTRLTCGFVARSNNRTRQDLAIFGWAEQRFHNDHRPHWGKTAHGGVA